jgi:hypothetical protein
MFEIKKEILKLLTLKLESSSFILLPNIQKSKYVLSSLVWLILSLVSFGWCAWFMSRSIIDYFSYDVISKTEFKYETSLLFPVITICNLNQFNTEYSREFLSKVFNSSYPNMDYELYANDYVNQITTQNISLKYQFGKRLDETIIKCKFGIYNCNLNEDFELFYDDHYGNCYRFNSGKNMNGKTVERRYANAFMSYLEMVLWIGPNQNNYDMFSEENGMVVFMNNNTADLVLGNGVTISPSYSTRISLDKINVMKKPQPYSNCVDNLNKIDSYDSLIFKKVIEKYPNYTYTYMVCFFHCLQKTFGQFCDCQTKNSKFIYYETMRFCFMNDTQIYEDKVCMEQYLNNFLTNSKYYLNQCDCPIECNYDFYRYSISTSEFPTRQYSAYLAKNSLIKSNLKQLNSDNVSLDDFDQIRKSVAKIVIYYGDMTQTFITEYAKTQIADLVACVGGILGLFMGISFLSFIEIFDLLIQFIYICINKSKSTKVEAIINVKNPL